MDRTPGTKALTSTSMMATAVALGLAIGIALPASAAAATTEPAASPAVAPALEVGAVESSSPTDVASTPASDALSVLSTEELSSVFARLATAGGQATVVADTTIRRDVPRNQLRCAPRGQPRRRACPIGVIEPGAPGRGFMPVVARKSARMAIPGDRSPVEGTMGYRIDGERLELLGPLAATTFPLVAVDPEAVAAADSLPVGSLIAVDGWLGVLGSDATCPVSPEHADASSPFAVCPAGWITASDGVPSEASGEIALTPDDFGIRVQSGAYEDFAPDGQTARPAGQPRRATYLLRRVQGTSADDSALGWKVIGRVDPVEGAGPPTATAEERGLLLRDVSVLALRSSR